MSYRLFEVFGVEIEHTIVRADTLDVFPAADLVLRAPGGGVTSELDVGPVTWSNELALHVIEQKTTAPVTSLRGVADDFMVGVGRIEEALAPHGGALLPGGMHPWMDPLTESALWPHEGREIYEAFDRVFGCRTHGWLNVQSVHLNLPFGDDAELEALHDAVRFLLPLLPALGAASPIAGGRLGDALDLRLGCYATLCARVPAIVGAVVPDRVSSRAQYEREVLGPIESAMRLLDPRRTLEPEWLNARGAIVRFDRQSVEIRVLDAQESPRSDLAILRAVVAVLEPLVRGSLGDAEAVRRAPTTALAALLGRVARDADEARVDDDYALALGVRGRDLRAGQVWRELLDAHPPPGGVDPELAAILAQGPLARRILRAVGPAPDPARTRALARELARCLREGRVFDA